MGTELMSLDPYMKNAYSADVKFDLVPRSCRSPRRREGHGQCVDIGVKSEPGKEWELDVRPMISSRKWLSNYGLKKNKLTLHQLLPSIGFKVSDEYDSSLKRPISSRYSQGYFPQVFRADGKTFNITCTKDKLCQIRNRLQQAVYLYRRRLEWLTTESRRIFGIVEEKALTIVLDIKNMSPHLYDQFCKALEMVLREQISQVVKFNIIRAAEDIQSYSQECVPVTHDTVEGAVQWLRKLDRLAPVSNSALCEAVMKALADDNNEAVYIFTEGSSSDNSRELLKEKVCATSLKVPIHCVSFNCDSAETIKFLKDFCQFTGGKFHAYAVVMEIDSYEPKPADPLTNKAHLVMKSKTFGGLPAGAGIREDVLLVYEELEEARRALKQMETLIEQAPEPKVTSAFQKKTGEVVELEEQYQSSVDWLKVYGLEARKLSLYHILNAVAFKHLDGVINFMRRAEEESQTDAVVEHKLVNAKYCDQFPVVRWKNGTVMHVQVTPDVYRQYEERMLVALNKIQQRIDWLKAGSRSLFGTVIEEEIYILIDCSASMQASLQFVKNKLFVLLQEQLRHKKRFNLVAFNSKAQCWRTRLVEVNEESLQSAWAWIQGLSCWGSTNTYAALQLALNDPSTQAIYLLTDGRPDQPPRSILAQVQMQCRVPMHTISFNCDDMDANQFLYDLAKLTGGRYHYYSDNGPHPEQPEAFESQDIKELKEEMQRGLESLEKLADLRDQCTALAWRREVETMKSCSRDHPLPVQGKLVSAVPPLNSKDLYRPDSVPPRPSSAPLRPRSAPPRPRPLSARPPSPRRTPAPPPRPSTSLGFRQTSTSLRQSIASRPRSARPPREPLKAGHTRTSLMRTLNSNGRFTPTEWLLPETKGMFEKQAVRQKHLAEILEELHLSPRVLPLPQEENMHERIRSRRRKRLVRRKAASTREWLKKYGLSAKRLTILDALGPTLVPHNAKYVPILDKHVVSKVFDEILPIAHVNKWKQVRLVNPTGVDLKAYEAKLCSAIALYERRLNKLVWDALPNDVREELGGEEPISFEDNRSRLMRALDAAGWPVKEQDISLLEAEIARGRKFLRLSQDLRKANVPSTDDADSDVQELAAEYARQNRLDEDKYEEPKDDDDVDAKDDDAKDDEDDEDREVPEEAPAAADADDESKERPQFEGLGQVVQSVEPDEEDRAVETVTETKKKKKKKVSSKRAQKALDTLKGYRVIARLDEDGIYYPGHVQKSVDFRHAVVRFDSMHRSEKVLSRFIIPMSGAVARPSISRGDPVLIRVVNVDNDTECYIPGIVYCEPARDDHAAKFYTVHLYNGQKACTMRKHLVKLSKTRYEFTVRYIYAAQNLDEGIHRSRSGSRPRSPTPPSSCSRSYSSDSESRSRSPDQRGRYSRSSSPPRSPRYVSRPSRHSPRRTRGRNDRRLSCEREPTRGHHSRSSSRSNDWSDSVTPAPPARCAATDSSSDEELPPREAEPTGPSEDSYRRMEETPREQGESARQLQELRSQLEAQEEQLKEKQKELKRKARSLRRKEKELDKKGKHKRDQKHQTSIDDDALDPYGQLPLLEMRRVLPALQHGEEVLARWPDEGWYFRGTVYQDCRDFSYFIKDGANHLERIWREDIISEKDDQNRILKVNSPVVALHPDYSFSYAPGVIMDITPDLHYIVSFYDGVEAKLPFDEVYRLSDAKYRHDVKEIKACEARWIGKAVVSRDDELGVYRLGQVRAQLSSGQQYEIEWSDGTCAAQRAIHLFGPMSKRYPVNLGEKVLALADQDRLWYLPGEVTRLGHKAFQVTFCNNEVGEVSYDDYFWLTQAYYEEAVKFFKECMRKMGF